MLDFQGRMETQMQQNGAQEGLMAHYINSMPVVCEEVLSHSCKDSIACQHVFQQVAEKGGQVGVLHTITQY